MLSIPIPISIFIFILVILYCNYRYFIILDKMSKQFAKKFFVLYCPANLYRPAIYTTQKTVDQKIKKINQLKFNQFDSEIQAQKFAFQKKMSFFMLRDQIQKVQNNKLLIQKFPPLQQKTSYQSENQAQVEQSKYGQKLIKRQKNKKNEKMQSSAQESIENSKNKPKKQIAKQDTISSIPKQEEVEVENENEKEKQSQNIKQLLNVGQASQEMKQMAKIVIAEKELQSVWEQILYNFKQKSPKLARAQKNHVCYAFFDGCSKQNPGPSGAGYYVMNKYSKKVIQRSFNLGWKTNNQAEYLAVIFLLMDCYLNGIKRLQIRGDSNLVVQGMKQKFNIKNDNIKYLNVIALHLSKKFQKVNIDHIDRQQNKIADNLANAGLKKAPRNGNSNSHRKINY